ncbi:alanyl-tRNA synthetase [Lysobacter arseniciresistens ZS79]|uniref:Alanine--tRNA ligase n=1 Tax=Lysobacter arseniciresistens ZS79 TaxID=913325 RepID=A0A0A0EX63_9GAMM|nr:alanine--tRNA ligase [Lysobacter arseniciresistens]KGM53747.1 alanyl-tRNA synthetase [Lysobacter arseniciresistens ZS79]
MKTTNDIRRDFLEFFRERGHTIVPSAPLVPANDPTLLFTNSGMVQFKNVFLGSEKPGYVRAADVQRCLRAGGKHNDLDQVGYTARHHTFFEMLGNWSFGDYFKEDAIKWAWQLLTEVWKLPAERLTVTVYQTDDEAYAIWRDVIGVPEARIIRIGDNKGAPFASDNFWQMADTGPCGPCTEVFYDHGEQHFGGPPGSPDEDGDRFIEIWNLVFMQFDRQPDGTLAPLPAPCVDTGMGLERIAAILQGRHGNYEIDIFQHLIKAAAALTDTADLDNKSLRVIADHIRACAFLVVDGVLPSNEGRGYVLRRIIRRALRHGWMLGRKQPFFHRMLGPLIEAMGDAYPELEANRSLIDRALLAEEERFAETLDSGMRIFDEVAARSQGVVPGVDAFRLYDTYGFPVDLTADIARERGLSIDMDGFEAAMAQQRETARAAGKFGGGTTLPAELVAQLQPSGFLGYDALTAGGLEVVALLRDGRPVDAIAAGDEALVILDRTPFYAESGGQVGDTGELDLEGARFTVTDTLKLAGQFHGHVGRLASGSLKRGDRVLGSVDSARRGAIVLNHSATHLLHAALRSVLGEHVAQKGSLVAPERLRFDFSHFQPVTADELAEIERRVNAGIRANHEAEIHHMGMQDALDFGAMALFGEKYGDEVRVLRMGDASTELCGGTHVARTGDIGLFKILSEGGVSAGVRRIEAVSGQGALDHVALQEQRLAEAARLLGGTASDVADKLRGLLDRQKKAERELDALKARAASGATSELSASAVDVGGIKVLAARVEGLDAKALRDALDRLKQQLGDAVVLLAGASDGKAALVAGVSGAALGRVKAGELLAHVAAQVNGKGGGRPDMAQGGGEDGPALVAALAGVPDWVAGRPG